MLEQSIALAREELAGRGLFLKRKAKGARVQLLKNQIMEWETLLEKLSGTFGIHQDLLTSRLVYTQYLASKAGQGGLFIAESVRAIRAWVQISLTVDGFLLPDGLYRTQPNTDSRVCGPEDPEHLRFLGLKAFKALASQGYKPQISEIKSADEQLRGQSRINALFLAVVRKYWLWQAHRENKQALALVEALMAETSQHRFDEAFGVIRTELERNELLSQRVQELERDISEAFWVEEEIRLERDHYERVLRE